MKRFLDIIASASGIVLLSPFLILAAIAVRFTSPGPVLFKQRRIGKDFRPFEIYKFRTMVRDAPSKGAQITMGEDPRITRVGRLLRKTKIDEFPQLFNVLKGDMSLVGPRPEVPALRGNVPRGLCRGAPRPAGRHRFGLLEIPR